MKLSTYVIGQGDSIETLARVLLGDASKSDQLIKLNQLRYPYISDDPADRLGGIKGTALLTGSYTNPSSITINNVNSINILQNDSVLLSEGTTYSSAVVSSVSGSTITLTSALSGSFDAGAFVYIYTNQQNVTTQVLKTGDTLLYPSTSSASLPSGSDYSLLLGTDFKLDSNGFLVRSAKNDIDTVSGLDNLGQALTMRQRTPLGTLNLHEFYGNGLFSILGEGSSPYFIGLAKHYVVQCALQDLRIQSAEVASYSINGDMFTIALSVIPIGAQDPVVQTVSIKIGGVS